MIDLPGAIPAILAGILPTVFRRARHLAICYSFMLPFGEYPRMPTYKGLARPVRLIEAWLNGAALVISGNLIWYLRRDVPSLLLASAIGVAAFCAEPVITRHVHSRMGGRPYFAARSPRYL